MDKIALRNWLKQVHYRLGVYVEELEHPEVWREDHEWIEVADKLEDAQSHIKAALDQAKELNA
jgi:hypothetical protein